jgi:hypothetical protein
MHANNPDIIVWPFAMVHKYDSTYMRTDCFEKIRIRNISNVVQLQEAR